VARGIIISPSNRRLKNRLALMAEAQTGSPISTHLTRRMAGHAAFVFSLADVALALQNRSRAVQSGDSEMKTKFDASHVRDRIGMRSAPAVESLRYADENKNNGPAQGRKVTRRKPRQYSQTALSEWL
jgi:hypothetical protein